MLFLLSLLFGFWRTTYALFVIAFALFCSVVLCSERIWCSVRKRGKAEGRGMGNGVERRIMLVSVCNHTHLFGANQGPRPSTDSPDGLAFPTKMKTFWVIKYLNIYSTNK